MPNVQVRLPDDLEGALRDLAADLQASRSDAARSALVEGIRVLRIRRALERYVEGRFSLARAAEEAGVSLQEMAQAAAARGIPYLRHSVEEAERDAATASDWLSRRD